MSLDYEFAPIDVDIISHPKACAAGVEAMGLWLWGQVHAKLHAPDGRLSRSAVLAAWGGRRNIILAKKLEQSGLWLAREDGDWDIHNFIKKGPGSRRVAGSSSAARMARKRERDASCDASLPSQSDASQVTVTSTSISTSLSSSSGSQIASWWGGACDAAAMAIGGEVGDRPARWAEYHASRDRKGWAENHGDAVGWLTTVVRLERTKASASARGVPRQQLGTAATAAWMDPTKQFDFAAGGK